MDRDVMTNEENYCFGRGWVFARAGDVDSAGGRAAQ